MGKGSGKWLALVFVAIALVVFFVAVKPAMDAKQAAPAEQSQPN